MSYDDPELDETTDPRAVACAEAHVDVLVTTGVLMKTVIRDYHRGKVEPKCERNADGGWEITLATVTPVCNVRWHRRGKHFYVTSTELKYS